MVRLLVITSLRMYAIWRSNWAVACVVAMVGIIPVCVTVVRYLKISKDFASSEPSQFTDARDTFIALPYPFIGCGTYANLDSDVVNM